jgi:hypothetical protein
MGTTLIICGTLLIVVYTLVMEIIDRTIED